MIVTTATGSEGDAQRNIRAHSLFVRSDAGQLAELVRRVDAGELHVDVSASYPLAQLADVQDRGAADEFRGKVIVTVHDTLPTGPGRKPARKPRPVHDGWKGGERSRLG